MRKRKILLSLVVILGAVIFFSSNKQGKAAEAKYGYGYKEGKLFSVEINNNKATILDASTLSGGILPGYETKLYRVGKRNQNGYYETYFFVDHKGKKISEEYDEVNDFYEGLACVGKKQKDGNIRYGFINEEGSVVIPLKYNYPQAFSDGMAIMFEGEESDEKCGMIDKTGKIIIPFQYQHLGYFNQEGITSFGIRKGDDFFQGLINKEGKEVLKPEYISVDPVINTDFFSLVKGKWDAPLYGLANAKGELIVPAIYERYEFYEEEKIFVLSDEENVGVVNHKGKIIVPFDVAYVSPLQEGKFFVGKLIDGKQRFGLVDTEGRVILPFEYTSQDDFDQGLARVCKSTNYDAWGLIDKDGKEVVPCEFDYIYPFSEDLAAFKDKKGNYGFLDRNGKVALDLGTKYSDVQYFSDGYAPVKKGEKWGYIDKKGKLVIPAKFDEVDDFIRGLARIYVTDAYGNRTIGMINKKGKIVVPVKYTDIEYKDGGEIKVGVTSPSFETKYGFLNKKGKMILPTKYDNVFGNYGKVSMVSRKMRDGKLKYGLASKDGKLDKTIKYDDIYYPENGFFKTALRKKDDSYRYGLFDSNGKEVLKCEYDAIGAFAYNNKLAIIEKKGKKGLINHKGKIVSPVKYTSVSVVEKGAIVGNESNGKGMKYGIINNDGKFLLKLGYDSIEEMPNGLYLVRKKGKEGYVDLKGKAIIPIKYDSIGYFWSDDYVIAEKAGKKGIINQKGKKTTDFIYDNIVKTFEGEGMNFAGIGEKIGYVSKKGEIIIPVEYDSLFLKDVTY